MTRQSNGQLALAQRESCVNLPKDGRRTDFNLLTSSYTLYQATGLIRAVAATETQIKCRADVITTKRGDSPLAGPNSQHLGDARG